MSELLLIPFGLRLSDQQFVDVSQVKKGRKCNCICPSCKTQLIARQGEIKVWHFAHMSKGVSNSTENECEYSLWVSVALMAKQILAAAKFINLPSLTMYASDGKEVKITDEKEVIINHVEIEQRLNSISADAVLKIDGYVIAVIFSTPNKNLENIAFNSDDFDKVGILEISLSNAYQWLFDSNNQGQYSQILKSKVLSNNTCKKWIYHPTKAIIENHYNIELHDSIPKILGTYQQEIHQVKHRQYSCIMCKHNWFGTYECERCGTHLYSREI